MGMIVPKTTATGRFRAAVLVAVVLAGAFFVYGGPREVSAQALPPALEAAISADIQGRGEEYAGECAVSQDPAEDRGKWCSETVLTGSTRATVRIGPTFAEYMRTLTFEWTGEIWSKVADVPDMPDPSGATTADFTVLRPDGTPLAGAVVTVSSATMSISGTTDEGGVARLDVSMVLATTPVGRDGLQRFTILVEANGYGRLSIVNQYFGGPGAGHGATVSEEDRVEDRICIPRAASVFHHECPDYEGTPGPPPTGAGHTSAVPDGGSQLHAAAVFGGIGVMVAVGLASWHLRRTGRREP